MGLSAIDKKIVFLVVFFVAFSIGGKFTLGAVTEVKTECGLFDCYTNLHTSFDIPDKYIGSDISIKKLADNIPNSYLVRHKSLIRIGRNLKETDRELIRNMRVKIIDKNTIQVYGTIEGASKNKWGLVLSGDRSFENSTWWNSSWSYRKNITITENSGNDLRKYPIDVWFNHEGNANADCSDIRVINNTNNETDFGLKNCNSTYVELAFKINVSASSNINYTVYYGNPSAPFVNISWEDARYNFYDDFEDTDFSEYYWDTANQDISRSSTQHHKGSYSAYGSQISGDGYSGFIVDNTTFDSDDVFYNISVWWYDNGGSDSYYQSGLKIGTVANNNVADIGYDHADVNGYYAYYMGDGWTSTGVARSSSNWYFLTIIMNNSYNSVYLNNILKGTSSTNVISSTGTIHKVFLWLRKNDAYWDELSIAKYVTPEPTYSFGSEETTTTTTTTTTIYIPPTPIQIPDRAQKDLIMIFLVALFIMIFFFLPFSRR